MMDEWPAKYLNSISGLERKMNAKEKNIWLATTNRAAQRLRATNDGQSFW